jgi:hypothetical protein
VEQGRQGAPGSGTKPCGQACALQPCLARARAEVHGDSSLPAGRTARPEHTCICSKMNTTCYMITLLNIIRSLSLPHSRDFVLFLLLKKKNS